MKKQICIAIVLSMILCLMPSAIHAVQPQQYCSGHLDLPDGYTYLKIPFTAPGDGVLTVTITNLTPGVEIGFGLSGNPEYTQYDAGEAIVTYEVFDGASYDLEFWGYDFIAGFHAATSFDYQITYSGSGTVEPYTVPARGETAGMPIDLKAGISHEVIPAGKQYYFSYLPSAHTTEQLLTVTGESGFQVIIEAWDEALGAIKQFFYQDLDGTVEIQLSSITGAFQFMMENLLPYDVAYTIDLTDAKNAAPDGTSENPFVIDVFPYEIVVDTGRYDLYYTFTPEKDGKITISYPAGNFVLGLQNYQKDEENLLYTVNVYAGVPITLSPCGDYAGSYVINWIEEESGDDYLNDVFQGSGTLEDPYLIETLPHELNFSILNGEQDIFFQYTAQEDGVILLQDCTCVCMVILGNDWVNSPSVTITAGTQLLLNFCADTPGNYSVSLKYAEPEPEKLPLKGSLVFDSAQDDEAIVLLDVPAAGVIDLNMSGDPGYALQIISPAGELLDTLHTGVTDGVFSYCVSETGVYQIKMIAYDTVIFAPAAGTIVYDIAFTQQAQKPDQPQYAISDVVIHEPGSFDIPMLDAQVTIFTFYPMHSGVYQFTVGSNVLIGYYGADGSLLLDMSEVQHAVTFQWTCAENPVVEYETIFDADGDPIEIPHLISGQKAMIGIISSDSSAIVTIEKVGEYEPPVEDTMEWTEYVPDESPLPMPPTEENDYVSIVPADDISTVLVLGEDGYYHFGTSDGPLVVIDLSLRDTFAIDFTVVDELTPHGYLLYLNDELIAKYDCTAFLRQLQAAGPVALSEEILNLVINVGRSNGWWTQVNGGAYAEHPNAWMGLCSYVEGTENDSTGDGIVLVIGLLAGSGMGISVLKLRRKALCE